MAGEARALRRPYAVGQETLAGDRLYPHLRRRTHRGRNRIKIAWPRRSAEFCLKTKFERVLVKVTWHGYATGAYTDPAALDLLLGALPAPAIVLEGHTSSRNLGGAEFDWETEAKENRAWIRQQEAEFLRRTGLHDVLVRHRAEFVNVTEAFWDEDAGDGDPTKLRAPMSARLSWLPDVEFRQIQGPDAAGNIQSVRSDPSPAAQRLAWTEHHMVCASML